MIRDVAPAVRAHRRRPARPGRAAGGARHRAPTCTCPRRGCSSRFLEDGARRFVFEGSRVRRPRRPARQLRAVGGADRACCWRLPATTRRRAARALRRRHPRRALGGDGRRPGRARWPRAGRAIGVLMGTAYLFTEEAVAARRHQPRLPGAGLACERTVLLETAPGHATRCAETPFVDAFQRRPRRRLAADGRRPREIVGRAGAAQPRPAAGRRQGPRAATATSWSTVDEDEQRARGHVHDRPGRRPARRASRTVAALHRAGRPTAPPRVARPARDRRRCAVARAPTPAPPPARRRHRRHGLLLPRRRRPRRVLGATSSAASTPSPRSRPSAGTPTATTTPTTVTDAPGARRRPSGAASCPTSRSTRSRYGIPPASLAAIEPVQLLALEVARRRAGRRRLRRAATFDRARTSVDLRRRGAAPTCPTRLRLPRRAARPTSGELPPELDEQLPELTEDSFPGMLANVIAGRIANRLDLGGANYTVDAACALVAGRARRRLQGAARPAPATWCCAAAPTCTTASTTTCCSPRVHALSPTGRCRTFDADGRRHRARRGRRLRRAQAAGRRRARRRPRSTPSSRASAASSDGRASGLTAPRPEGQLRGAATGPTAAPASSPAEVGLVEAHGTGTVVGDRTELATLTEVFAEAGRAAGPAASLGSVKSQIGHTKCAAGLAGLIKAALALHHGVLPPTLQRRRSRNPAWDAGDQPVLFLDEARPWAAPQRRVAGVSAFGFGGTNFHAVLAALRRRRPRPPRPRRVAGRAVRASGRRPTPTSTGALERPRRPAGRADDRPGAPGGCATSPPPWPPPGAGPVQAGVVADDLDDLRAKLGRRPAPATARRLPAPATRAGGRRRRRPAGGVPVPGQGSQRPGMLADLFVAFPELRGRCCGRARAWAPTMLPAGRVHDAEPGRAARGRHRHPGGPARARASPAWPSPTARPRSACAPTWSAGHSYGELVALCAAGASTPTTLLALSEARAEAILGRRPGDDPGAHGGRGRRAPTRSTRCSPAVDVVVANHNHPNQIVIPGPTAGGRRGRRPRSRPPASPPSASRWPAPSTARWWPAAADDLRRATSTSVEVAEPILPVWSATSPPTPYPADGRKVRRAAGRARWPAACASPSRSGPCTRPAPGSSSRSGRAGC